MERFYVTAATGALGPVLQKLNALLGDEYKLQEETRQDIMSLKSELEPVHDLLGKLWGKDDLDAVCKDWMAEARELSYDLEDDINRSERGDSGFINKFMKRARAVSSRRGEMQMIGICCGCKLATDTGPRALFRHKDASELVGMDEKEDEFGQLLQEHEMVCIVGFAGEGKTTLADLVYQTIGDRFQCRAFVSVHQNPNMIKILGTILSQVTNGAISAACGSEPGAEENIINELSKFLTINRYLVIIDDIWGWEEWEVIRKALPKNSSVGALAESPMQEGGYGQWDSWKKQVAEVYFEKLVSRNLLQPVQRNIDIYRVHPMMLAFLVCKSKEDNFVACWQYGGSLGSSSKHGKGKRIRRLSFYCMDGYPDEDVSHTRSLVVIGPQEHLALKEFKNLQVLEIDSEFLLNGHLVDICGLIWLRYLHLKGRTITELPREIERLKNLETLDVSGTGVKELPREIGGLENLEILVISGTKVTELPKEIGGLTKLETLDISVTKVIELPWEIMKLQCLQNLDVSWTGMRELPKEIEKMQSLRTLDIRNTEVRELHWKASQLPNSFSMLVGDLHSHHVVKLPQDVSPDWENSSVAPYETKEGLSIVLFDRFGSRWEPIPVPRLKVAGRHLRVPQWVKQHLSNASSLDIRLWKLEKDDVEFLKTQMPNLQALALRLEVLPEKPIAITGGEGFSKLEAFYIDCRLPRVITFQRGAMPKLKHLEFKFYNGRASKDYPSMGIKNLPQLEKVVFRCSENYTDDGPGISAMIELVRKEAKDHSNKEINFYVNADKEKASR
nr:unnamed protein product [Digitaria exilis]